MSDRKANQRYTVAVGSEVLHAEVVLRTNSHPLPFFFGPKRFAIIRTPVLQRTGRTRPAARRLRSPHGRLHNPCATAAATAERLVRHRTTTTMTTTTISTTSPPRVDRERARDVRDIRPMNDQIDRMKMAKPDMPTYGVSIFISPRPSSRSCYVYTTPRSRAHRAPRPLQQAPSYRTADWTHLTRAPPSRHLPRARDRVRALRYIQIYLSIHQGQERHPHARAAR